MSKFAGPLLVFREMVWSRAFSWQPPMERTLSSASPAWLLESRSTVLSPVGATFRITVPTVPPGGPTAICSSKGLSTCTPLVPPHKLRKGRLASGAMAPLTRKVSSTSTPCVPPPRGPTPAAAHEGAGFVVTLPEAATEPASSWAKSAVVAFRVLAALTVTSWSSELLLDEVEEAVALGHRRVPSKVPGVERREVAAAQVPPVRFRLRIGVAGELERGVREDGVDRHLIIGGVTLVRTRDSKLALALAGKYRASASAWVRKPAPAMASISVWVRELVQYWVKVAVSWESSSLRG